MTVYKLRKAIIEFERALGDPIAEHRRGNPN